MPLGNREVMVHYRDTIVNKVDQKRIFKYTNSDLQQQLVSVFGSKPIAVWGSQGGSANRSRFERMRPGDDVLIVEGATIKLLGKIATTTKNPDLSRELWLPINNIAANPWELIYFIANPLEIELPFEEFKKLFNYSSNWSLRGFTNVSDEKLEYFYDHYDDLYSILQRIKNGEIVEQKPEKIEKLTPVEISDNDDLKNTNQEETSDHIRMQWKLSRLGLKCGSKIWVPKNDQSRVRNAYNFTEFEEQFATGIDTPGKYVENIDVVWKEEFRIDAAFEIENSTSIYSGLLRFSDLKIVAPNSNYPLFIVAPNSRKHKVYEQVTRPTFKRMDFDKKVRFLSYEAVDEVDHFFENNTAGLNINLLTAKSESL